VNDLVPGRRAAAGALIAAGRRLAEGGLVTGTAGNLSVRVGDHVLATGSGTTLGDLTAERLSLVDLDGTVLDGPRPTSELPLHLAVYRSTDATAIAHAHATASVAVGATNDVLPPIHYLTVQLGGVVRVADYATFGSTELATHVRSALEGRHAALLRNHGSVATGTDIGQACDRLELVEWLAEVYRQAATLGTPTLLTEAQLVDAAATFTRLDYPGY
jgi:L-fuculose-phosphate aldolase